MERKKSLPERVDAILTSDWHLRDDIPKCRTDDFVETLIRKMDFVSSLQRKYQCPIIHAGDLFHFWKSVPYLITIAIQHLPKEFNSIYGQHDLPQHNQELIHKSAWTTLFWAGKIAWIKDGGNWGREPEGGMIIGKRKVTAIHRLVWKGDLPWPGCTDPSAREVLEAYPEFDLIVTGDNHRPFVERLDGRILVNPGSLTRQTADQIDFKPRVYLWDSKKNDVTPVYIPIDKGVVTREHLEEKEERDSRIQAFVEMLTQDDWSEDLDFVSNLNRFLDENEIRKSVREIVYRAIDKEG